MTSLAANAALGTYRVFGSLVVRPLAPLLLSYRVSRGKEDRSRLGERYGRASRPRPDGAVVWIHAASVGETNAVLPLIKEITASGRSVVFTTVTLTAARIAEQRLPPGAVHQFSPIDIRRWVKAFIAHWRPELAIFVESELWPQAIFSLCRSRDSAGHRQRPAVEPVLRGLAPPGRRSPRRCSRGSACAWRRPSATANATARSACPRSTVTGNLKFDTPPPGADPAAQARAASRNRRPPGLARRQHPSRARRRSSSRRTS